MMAKTNLGFNIKFSTVDQFLVLLNYMYIIGSQLID